MKNISEFYVFYTKKVYFLDLFINMFVCNPFEFFIKKLLQN